MSPEPRSDQGSFTLADAIAAVGQGDLSHRVLTRFSDLGRDDARAFARGFPALGEFERARLIQALDDLVDLSIEYDFSRVFDIALDDESPVVRQRAMAALWEAESTVYLDRFMAMLDDESVDVRAEAAALLGRFAQRCEEGELPESTAEALYTRLRDLATDPRAPQIVARRALESLGNFGSRAEVHALILDANDHDDQSVRAGALFAMGRTMDSEWLDLLMDELHSDDPELRFEAARALGAIGDTRAVEGLARLASDDDGEVRSAAIAAIGAIGSPGSERVLRRLAERATDEDEITAIVEALEELESMDSDRWDLEN
ncbi:MAG: HEAT repeat domain-containing protein [Thermomicrobiales bacterium]|nr:HEAT repeat domain-containing protein [Thermomicrobiales bacterium]